MRAGNVVAEVVAVFFFGVFFALLMEGNLAKRPEDVDGEGVERARFFEGEAVLDDGLKDFDQDAIDVFGSGERGGGLKEFGGEEFIGGRSGLVREAEGRAGEGEHAAAMSVRFGEGAARGCSGREEIKFHGVTPRG